MNENQKIPSNNLPLVTIVSPCYNHSSFVIESLESIRLQTYKNINHIIIDDFSTDNSVLKIERWIAENNYKCIFIKHKKNKGLSHTLNESIEITEGKYWSALATDDVMIPNRTELFVEYLEKNNSTPMVVSNTAFLDSSSTLINYNGFESGLNYFIEFVQSFNVYEEFGTYESLITGNYIPASIFIRTNIFKKTGRFDTKLKMEDWEMWLRISRICGRIGYIDSCLTYYRIHNNNTVSNKKLLYEESLKILIKQKKYVAHYSKIDYYNKQINIYTLENLNKRKYNNLKILLFNTNFWKVSKIIVTYFFNKTTNEIKFYAKPVFVKFLNKK